MSRADIRSIKNLLPAVALLAGSLSSGAVLADEGLKAAVADPARTDSNAARDIYRHPYETLMFFGIEPDMTVVELWPGGGWYSEILVPYLRGDGQYIGAHFSPESSHPAMGEMFSNSRKNFDTRVATDGDVLFGAEVVSFEPPRVNELVADGSVDLVLTFRNAHNWMRDAAADDVLQAVYAALKPGGILGVVDHRANEESKVDGRSGNGYVHQQQMINMAEAAGFEFVASSEINANPKDTANHPRGVWTLPPRSAVPDDEDPQKYLDIGESDRFTLKFRKPE